MKNVLNLILSGTLVIGLSTGNVFADTNGGDRASADQRPLTRVELAAKLASIPGLADRTGAGGVRKLVERISRAPVTSCEIKDAVGNSVVTVSAINVGDQAYWFQYNAGGQAATQVLFAAVPLFTGSPIDLIYQRFVNTGATNVSTPFGVPFWGGDLTSGSWVHIQVTDVEPDPSICLFRVVP